MNGIVKCEQNGCKTEENKNSPLNWLADLALQENDTKSEKDVSGLSVAMMTFCHHYSKVLLLVILSSVEILKKILCALVAGDLKPCST